MTDAPRKIYPQLTVQTDIVGTDLLASYRDPGPLKGLPASTVLDYISTGIQPLVDQAADSAAAAASDAADAQTAAADAEQAANESMLARIMNGYYPGSGPRSDVPRGAIVLSVTAGSGYTNGVYDITTTGGNFTVQATVRVTVSGGAIQTPVEVTGPGLYVGASPSVPTVPLGSLGGGTLGAIVLDAAFLIGSGEYYLTDDATDTTLADWYQNVAGVATPTSPLSTFKKSLLNALIPCTIGGTANAITMTPVTGYSVTGGGVNQEFSGFAAASNSAAGLTVAIPGVNSGSATQVLLPSGGIVPALGLKTSYPFKVKWDTTLTKYILTAPTFISQQSAVNLYLMAGSTANALLGKIAHPEIKTPADFTGVSFAITTALDKISGGPSLTIYASDGTTVLLTATTIKLAGGAAATDAALWLANDTITVQRQGSGFFWLVKEPNPAINDVPAFAHAIDTPYGLPLSDNRPVSCRKTQVNTRIVKVKPPDSYYSGSYIYNHSDENIYTSFDMRNFQANVPNGATALNSFMATYGYDQLPICNLQFYDLEGINTDTGQVPSTFEPPFFAGNNADPVTGTNFDPRGIGHGYMKNTTVTIIGTLDGVDTANMYGDPVLAQFTGQKLVQTTTGQITDTVGNVLADVVYRETWEQDDDYTVKVYASYDWDAAAVTPATVGAGAYCLTVPMRNVNKAVGYLNGSVVGVPQTINLRNASITNFGLIDTYIAWDTAKPRIQTVVTNLIGQGKSCKINTVAQTAVNASVVQNNTWGPKLIGIPIYALGTTKQVLSGLYEFEYGIKIIDADPIT